MNQESGKPGEQEEVTGLVCEEADLKDGQMKEVTVGDQKVLLVRTHGQYSAIGNQCTHYSAALVKGALSGDRVRCPFHGACFNVKTGDIEEYPGLDSVPSYKVKLSHLFFVISGPASLVCAETLRQNCYQGRIIIMTKDTLLPFDKTKLSKAMNLDSSSILLRSSDFLQQYGIEVWTQKEVRGKKANCLTECSIYHVISLSSRPLSCPGSDLKGVNVLQCYEDAKEINGSSPGHKAVVIGASFIGMEVASYLSDKAASVALVGTSRYPYERSLGPEIGNMSMQMLEEQNVKFYMKDEVTEIRGENGKVKEVVLKSGTVLEADVVIAGIGNYILLLQGFCHELLSLFKQYMRTNIPDVFAAGDVTSFPLTIRGDQRVNIGHWQMSQAHGRIAALNMLKKPTKIESIPFFWTVLLGKSIRYAGYAEGYTEIVFKGKVEERKFVALYIKDEVVVAAASLMFDPAVSRVAELMATGQTLTKAQAQ
uniref:Rieske domain-containing protein n=1 Tax=Amphiprion ocellaris TaxID=80972 RepID=A0AAQ5X4B0_AMPOC